MASFVFFAHLSTLMSGTRWGRHRTTTPDDEVSLRGCWTAWAVLGLVLLVTGWAWYTTNHTLTERGQARFDEAVHEAHAAVLNRIAIYEKLLIAGRGLFAASRVVERSEWHAFVHSLEVGDRFPGIQGIGFASYIPDREKGRYVAGIRREGFPDFRIDPIGTRDEYAVTTYIEPFADRNIWEFGFDMYSEPARRVAMDLARDSGRPVISGRVTLVQGPNQDPEHRFFLYVPIYKKGMPVQTSAERRAALIGFTFAPFLVNDLMAGVLGSAARDIRMQIFDGPATSSDTLLYGDEMTATADVYRPAFQRTISSELSGRTWTFVFSAWPSFDATVYRYEPVIVVVTGLMVGLLLFGITWSLTTTRARAVALAQRMTDALRQSEAQFRAVADYANEAIVSADANGCIVRWNAAAANIFGYDETEVLGEPLSLLTPERFRADHLRSLQGEHSEREQQVIGKTLELTGLRKNGSEFALEISLSIWSHGEGRFYTAIMRDITERKHTQERLDYLATHDALTGLPNRTLFADRLEQALTRSVWNKRLVAVMFLDLDRFKTINDTFGHDAGDRLLQTVATRLTAAVRDGDTVARMGGDEFTIILVDMAQIDDVALVAQKILNATAQPFDLNGHQTPVTLSIGIACYPVDGIDAPTLLKHADTALYRAKERGRNNYQLYSAA